MELVASRETVYRSLQLVQGVADKKNTMPILSNVLLTCHKNTLELSATDLEVAVRITIPVKCNSEGSTTVLARKLFEVIKEIPHADLSITADQNHNIKILSENISFRLKGLSPEDFPSFPHYRDDSFMEVDSATLREMVDKTLYAAASEDVQVNLAGIYMAPVPGNSRLTRFVATDGHRLSLIERNLSEEPLTKDGVIVPRKGVLELRRIIQDGDRKARLWVTGNQIMMMYDNVVMSVRLIDALFPDYEEVIPRQCKRSVSLNRSIFLEALKRASIVSMERFRAVRIELAAGSVTISSSNPDIGDSQEVISADYSGDPTVLCFNSRYFLDILNSLDSSEITMEVNDESSPAVIRDNEDDHFVAVVMPMLP